MGLSWTNSCAKTAGELPQKLSTHTDGLQLQWQTNLILSKCAWKSYDLIHPLSRSTASPLMPPLRMDLQAQTRAPLPTQSRSASHWPHSGPPDWHPPRPSPSPPPQRSSSETTELKRKLYDIFPDQKQRIDRILNDNPYMRDLNALSGLLLGWTHHCWDHMHKHTKLCFMSMWLQNNGEHNFKFFYFFIFFLNKYFVI